MEEEMPGTVGRKMNRGDLSSLKMAFAALVKAGEESLRRAYDLGQVIDALANQYTFDVLADAVDRHPQTVSKYARLYLRYPNVGELIRTARRYQTYDIGILVASEGALTTKYGHQCEHCGSWDTKHRRLPESMSA
jgi:hypothetical protein